jgi:hypothetical protein
VNRSRSCSIVVPAMPTEISLIGLSCLAAISGFALASSGAESLPPPTPRVEKTRPCQAEEAVLGLLTFDRNAPNNDELDDYIRELSLVLAGQVSARAVSKVYVEGASRCTGELREQDAPELARRRAEFVAVKLAEHDIPNELIEIRAHCIEDVRGPLEDLPESAMRRVVIITQHPCSSSTGTTPPD